MCGVIGIHGHPEAANLAYLGLHALQHRGQESCGIATTTDGGVLHEHRQMGHVGEVFTADVLARLEGDVAIGHVRYSTAGGSTLRNAQPFVATAGGMSVAVGHNGNLTNADSLRAHLEGDGAIFQSTMDTEVFVHLVARSRAPDLPSRVADAVARVKGAYTLVWLGPREIIGVRDPHGFRPLLLGRLPVDGARDAWVLASETSSFDLIGARLEREVARGEMVVIDRDGVRSMGLAGPGSTPDPRVPERRCIFELIYFARPDSQVFGASVYAARRAMGRALAHEHPAEADVVVPVPDSGVVAAIGYAEASGIPFEMGMTRSHYVGRTFIEPSQQIRHFGVKLKLSPVRHVIEGRRVVVVDDSVVRGTTSRKIVRMLRAVGAREVHLRVSSPPTIGPCHYGIDTPTREELIAHRLTTPEIAEHLGVDSLGYLSLEGLRGAVAAARGGFCDACFSNEYPA
jgi:amidophosphoribosyltransferase